MQHSLKKAVQQTAACEETMKERSNQPCKVGQTSHDYIGSLLFMLNSLWAGGSRGAKEAVMCSATLYWQNL